MKKDPKVPATATKPLTTTHGGVPIVSTEKLRQTFSDSRRALLIVSATPRRDDWLVIVRYRGVGEKAVKGMPFVTKDGGEAKSKYDEYVQEAKDAGWIAKFVGVSLPTSAFNSMPKAGEPSMVAQHV